MKLQLVLLLLVSTSVALSQSRVQTFLSDLDSLTLSTYDRWRVSPDLKTYKPAGDPALPGFDDSGWDILTLNQNVYPDSCWIRKEIVLPREVFGLPLRGPVRFILSVDDYGYLWVNGKSLGHFPWDGDFELTPNAEPGQRFAIAIKAINTGGPLRLIRAEVQAEQTQELRRLVDDLRLSILAGEKLLSFDTYQTNAARRTDPGIDKSTISPDDRKKLRSVLLQSLDVIDLQALGAGPAQKFHASLERWKDVVAPVSEFAKRFTLSFTANAHIDAAWLWREKETIEVCNNTFRSANNIMDAKQDATFAQSAAAYYAWMQELHPETFEKIRKRVQEGRWEIVGGMWVEPDCNLPSGDSWARHLLYAKSYFKRTFGVDVTLGWNPDSFGYNGNMPMIYRHAGIDAFITQKIGWNETNVFPHRVFWWESADGSRILSVFPFDYVNTIGQPFGFVDWLRQFEANTGFRKLIVLFGVGNHGGGPSLEMMRRIDRLKTLPIFPNIEFGTAVSYVSWLRSQDLTSLPVWKNELYLEYHQGTFTTQAAMKRFNRESETLLTGTETLASITGMLGRPYPSDALRTAWQKVLFNQFHDILPGSSIREVYIDATETHKAAQEIARWEWNRGIEYLASRINTAALPAGTPVVVFNQLSWERTDIARVELPPGDTLTYSIVDARGKELPSQRIQTGRYSAELLFPANVPGLGYSTYLLRSARSGRTVNSLNISNSFVENEFYRVTIDPATGWLKSVLDKMAGREVLSGPGNELQLLEDKPRAWDAWNVGLTGVQFPSLFKKIEVVERGPVRAILRLHRTYLKPGVKKEAPTEDFPSSFFTQDIILYAGVNRVDFRTDVDWWEQKTMLKVAFPLSIQDSVATYEIPYGTIQRSTRLETSVEKAQVEVPSHRWADVSTAGYGVSLLNRSKYGYDIKGNTIRLSLLRSPVWPDPTADRGKHSIEYSLAPHMGSFADAKIPQRGYEYNAPLTGVLTPRRKATLGPKQSFVEFSGEGLILTAIKKAEDSNAWIMTWYNTGGKASIGKLTFLTKPKKAVVTDILETDHEEIRLTGSSLTAETKPFGMTVMKVQW